MHEVKLPQLGQSVEEASIVEWYKKEGESVREGEPLFSVQTDKAEIECESTATGILRKQLVAPDELVPVMTVVALVGDAHEPLPDLQTYRNGAKAAPAASEATHAAVGVPAPNKLRPIETTTVSSPFPAASPRASAAAARLGVSLAGIAGSGPGGRILESDVLTATSHAAPHPASIKAPIHPGSKTIPLTPMRRIVAERMTRSKFSAPHFYVTVEADMTAAKAFREAQKDRPSYNDLVLAAVVAAIKRFPAVNAAWNGDSIVQHAVINLGFAVALESGLIVPVIHHAESKPFSDLVATAKSLAEKAKSSKLSPDDYAGSTFTVSNLGGLGVDEFTAIINQPDSAILAVGRMQDRPVAVQGKVVVRPIMKLTLSSDHRVIDGAVAARFMAELKSILENARWD